MGSGKTTVGRLLSRALRYPFMDLDDEVESAVGCSVYELITTLGEAEFRRLELAALTDAAELVHTPIVVATGGGIVETPEATKLLRRFESVVYLRADARRCVERLGAQRAVRPLLDEKAEWQQRWERRRPLYEKLADVHIDTESCGEEGSLSLLLQWLADSKQT